MVAAQLDYQLRLQCAKEFSIYDVNSLIFIDETGCD
jgi:hypothetical protein